MGLIADLDLWYQEHENNLGVHDKEVQQALNTVQNAMDMVGD